MVANDDPWRHCREVDANLLRACTQPWLEPRMREAEYEYERCLFYRGLGNFALPLAGSVAHERVGPSSYHVSLTLENHAPTEALEHIFLVWVGEEQTGWKYWKDFCAGGGTPEQLTLDDLALELQPSADAQAELVEALADALSKTGLYYKEALAMARTWQEGYFRDPGLRVLYVLDRDYIDRVLPLKIENFGATKRKEDGALVPDQIVRTFVGRTELLSPSREQALMELVERAANSSDPQAREAALEKLAELGRFAKPYLARVRALAEGLEKSRREVIEAAVADVEEALEVQVIDDAESASAKSDADSGASKTSDE